MCTNCGTALNIDASEAFAERMLEAYNNAALSLMTSIGHRTGLFDVMAELEPSTSEEIARESGLNERYVREWLGAMVCSRVVEYEPEKGTYQLPPEHAAFLTRKASPNNIAALAQYFPELGSVEDGIVECFEKGGGVPYSAFKRFHPIMAEDSGQTVLPVLFDSILPLAPGLIERLEEGIEVLDVGCGQGRAILQMAKRFPKSRFTGYDISEEATGFGTQEAKAHGLSNIRFVVQDAAEFSDTERFDLVCTFDAVHDQAKPLTVLKNIRRALKPGGTYLMQDIDTQTNVDGNIEHPIGTLIYTISCLHCMTVSLAAGGAGLGAAWGVQLAEQLLREAGFEEIRIERLPHDFQNCYYIMQKH